MENNGIALDLNSPYFSDIDFNASDEVYPTEQSFPDDEFYGDIWNKPQFGILELF